LSFYSEKFSEIILIFLTPWVRNTSQQQYCRVIWGGFSQGLFWGVIWKQGVLHPATWQWNYDQGCLQKTLNIPVWISCWFKKSVFKQTCYKPDIKWLRALYSSSNLLPKSQGGLSRRLFLDFVSQNRKWGLNIRC